MMRTAMKKLSLVFCALLPLSGCGEFLPEGAVPVSEAPEWCKKACETDGGIKHFYPRKTTTKCDPPEIVVRCNDGMFYPKDTPEKCNEHQGLMRRQDIGGCMDWQKPEDECFCQNGGLISK